MRSSLLPLLLLASALAVACDGRPSPTNVPATPSAAGDTRDGKGAALAGDPRRRPGYVVDSVLPTDEALHRFRAGLPDAPASFRHAAPSRATLVRRFADAVTRADTAALRALAIDRGEFAYLVYPESPYTRPPYRQAPGIVWMMLQQGSASGLRRLLRDRAERGAWRALSHGCDAEPVTEGSNRLWRNCRLQVVRAGGDTTWARLFGVIVEREGRFKFASFENDF
ncbi:MAG TPA: hypothetical protein VGD77_16195 [Gemmatimonadaceae bacterium]